jgi:hypothetical protein
VTASAYNYAVTFRETDMPALVRRLDVPDGLWRSLVSALDWGSRGPGFKSRQPD